MDGQSFDPQELRSRISSMREQHEALNHEVDALAVNGVTDQLKLARLKKEKLRIKDQLAALNDQLTPDIIA
ncbi:YdcH family protein [Maricaulis sp.]|uniref:YdcH family protein n=1 Tax=Maricaulis sp. TaxID=1486257 RepID=UPI003A8EBF17